KLSTTPTPTMASGMAQRTVLISAPGPVMAPWTKPDIASLAEYPESWKTMVLSTIAMRIIEKLRATRRPLFLSIVASDHGRTDLCDGCSPREVGDDLPTAEHADAVRDVADLVEVRGDDDDGHPLGREG